jgi:mono/diheme cytochrome c family protein
MILDHLDTSQEIKYCQTQTTQLYLPCTGIHNQMRENMTKRTQRAVLLLLIAIFAVACGTAVTPVFEAPDDESVTEENVEAVVVPTETAIPPSVTPEPPTATATDEPTVTPEPPTAIPTDEPTPTEESAESPTGDATNGEVLFSQIFTQVGFSCAVCHNATLPDTIVGPSLLNIKDVAGTRVDGLGAEEYLFNSIVNPNDYIVDGFFENVMPQTWGDALSDTEINDIVAYLLTLEG